MTFRLRPILILLALGIVNQSLCVTYGIYSRSVFFWTVAAFGLGLAASLCGDRVLRLPVATADDGTTLLLAVCAIVLTYLAMSLSHVSFNDVPAANARLPQLALAGFLLTLLLGVISVWEMPNASRAFPRPLLWLLLLAVLLTGFLLRAQFSLAWWGS